MNKEELEKEAEEKAKKRTKGFKCQDNCEKSYVMGALDFAEPREKRIAELEMTIGTLRTFSNEQAVCIERLEAQIEKMKCVQNCEFGYDGQYKNNCHKDYSRECNKDCKNCKDWKLRR